MRSIGWILAGLLAVGWVADELPPIVAPAESAAPDLWRRTRDGWERAEWLLPEPDPAPFWFHPAFLAAFQAGASITGFWALSRTRLHNRHISAVS